MLTTSPPPSRRPKEVLSSLGSLQSWILYALKFEKLWRLFAGLAFESLWYDGHTALFDAFADLTKCVGHWRLCLDCLVDRA